MGLTKERKLFIGILTLAGGALVIDRGLLASSEASGVSEPTTVQPTEISGEPSIVQASTKSSAITAAKLLMERLQEQDDSSQAASLGAGFSLDQLIQPVMDSEPAPEVDSEEQAPRRQLPVIQPTVIDLPTLTAVMPSTSGGGGAVLNGKLVRVGQTGPNGFTLMQVRERSVILKRDGRIHSVQVPTQGQP